MHNLNYGLSNCQVKFGESCTVDYSVTSTYIVHILKTNTIYYAYNYHLIYVIPVNFPLSFCSMSPVLLPHMFAPELVGNDLSRLFSNPERT